MILFAAILALAPAVYAWWTGRALIARIDDPAFPELLLARAQRRSQIAVAVAVGSAFVPGSHWLWSFPLFAVALLVGSFPFRRALYGETWSVGAYVSHALLGFVGGAGFWLALAFAPFLIFALVDGWAPGSSPLEGAAMVGAIVAAGLIAWEFAYPLVWLGLHRASPLQRAELTPRFDDIIARSTVSKQPPHVFRYGFRGAYVMNAIALPSMRQPRVAFGDSLLELLTPDEIVAVFAHEVSHLEYYNRRRMAGLRLITYLLILGGTALPAAILATTPAFAWTIKLIWPIAVLALLALRVSKSQAHETESDLRAGELTGDPEAMVRALTKLHHYSRMPRRWPYDFERACTHPSLARRIQSLRTQGAAAATMVAPKLAEPTVLRSTEPGAYVVLDNSRAYWFEGFPANVAAESLNDLREHATSYRAVAYTDLTELRVAVVRAGGRALLARDGSGKTWSMPLRPDDVAAAQRALDVLDVRLGNNEREDWRTKARAAATVLALTLVGAMDFGWTWLPLILTLAKPSAASVAAMGAMAIGRVMFAVLAGTLGPSILIASLPGVWLASVAAMFGIGVWCCRIAWRWARGENKPTQRPVAVVALALIAVLLIGALAMTTYAGVAAVGSPLMPAVGFGGAVALLLLGVGAALMTYQDNLRRRSGAAACVLGLAVAGLGEEGQTLISRRSTIAWTSGQVDVVGKVSFANAAYRLHLSPSGRHFAAQGAGRRPSRYEDEDEELNLGRFTLGTVAGGRRTTDAVDLAFVDDDRVLVLRPTPTSGDSLDLSVERIEKPDSVPLWRRTVPAYFAPTLMLDHTTGRWRVNGYDTGGSAVVTSVGRIGSDSVTTTRLASGLVGGRPLHTYSDGTSLIATLHGSFGWGRMVLSMFGFYPFRWDVWHVANGQRRSMGDVPGLPECGGANDRDEVVVCIVQGRSGASLWRFARRDGPTATSLGALPAGAHRWDIGTNGRVATASRDGDMLAIVDATTGRGTRITLGGGVQQQGDTGASISFTSDVAVASDVVATLVVRDGKAEVTLYRMK